MRTYNLYQIYLSFVLFSSVSCLGNDSDAFIGWLGGSHALIESYKNVAKAESGNVFETPLSLHGAKVGSNDSATWNLKVRLRSENSLTWEFFQLALLEDAVAILFRPESVDGRTIVLDPSVPANWVIILDSSRVSAGSSSVEQIVKSNLAIILHNGDVSSLHRAVDSASQRTGISGLDVRAISNTYLDTILVNSIAIAAALRIDISDFNQAVWELCLERPGLAALRDTYVDVLTKTALDRVDLAVLSLGKSTVSDEVKPQLLADVFLQIERISPADFTEERVRSITKIGDSRLTSRLLNLLKRKKIFDFNESFRIYLKDPSVEVKFSAYRLMVEQLNPEGAMPELQKVNFQQFSADPSKFITTLENHL